MEKSVLSIILAVGVAAVVVAGAAVLFGTDSSATDMPQVEMPGASDPSGNAGAGAPSQGTVAPESTQAQKATEDADDDAGEPEPTAAPATPEPTAAPTAEPTAEPTVSGSAGMAAYDGNDDSSPVTTRPVTDMKGNTVTIPYNVERVVCLYAPASAMVMAIDGGSADSLVGVDGDARDDEGFNAIDPTMADKTVVVEADGSLNKETLLSLDPDVIIAKTCGPAPDFTGIDVPVVWIDTASLSNIDAALTLIGDVRNKHSRATELVGYVQQKRNAILDATCDIPAADHETMYLSGSAPLKTFAGGKFHEEWANGAGCDLVSADLAGSYKPTVSIETIIDWDPELIILSHNLCTSDVTGDPAWQDINAVEHGHVYCIPRFVGDWASPVPESVLGMMWIANGTYHDCVNFDMVQETEDFYDLFYNYDMTDDEACELMGAFPACRIKTVEVTDGAGRTIELELPVERIVTNYPLGAEMVLTLGAQDRLVGVDEFTKDPTSLECLIEPEIADLISVGYPWSLNTETALALEPDLVLVPGWNGQESLDELADLGLPVYGMVVENDEQIMDTMTDLGLALEKEETADSFVTDYTNTVTEITDITQCLEETDKPRVYFAGKGGILYTCNPGMYQHHLIEEAGGIDVAGDLPEGGWTSISAEELAVWNPNVILIADYSGTTPEEVLGDERFQNIDAVENNQVYMFPSDICGWDCPGSQTCLGLQWLASGMHANLFDINILEEADAFYEKYYGISFSDLGGTIPEFTYPGEATIGSVSENNHSLASAA